MILRFFSSLLARFAKTFGLIFIVLGFVCAAYLGTTAAPRLESAHYRPSQFLSVRLSELSSHYDRSKQILLKFRGKAEFPDGYSAANAEPQFKSSYQTTSDFIELRKSLDAVASGRNTMKRYVTDTIDSLISDIEQKLLAHAQSLHSEDAAGATPSPSPSNPPLVTLPDIESLYDEGVSAAPRKNSLDEAKNYLQTLDESAANPDNKKKLETSMAEIDLLETLLPEETPTPSAPPVPTFDQKASPLPAEKVAAHLAYLREQIQRSMLLEWALDRAYDTAAAAAQSEEQACAASEFAVSHIAEDIHIKMAAAITLGLLLGVFFLLIGDWTQKSLTQLLSPPWCELIKGVSASPKEVYDIIEQHIAAREVPELEITREFWHEGGALSAKREYLRLARERLVFEICAAPFGTGFFVSFRLCEIPLTIDPLAIFILFFVMGVALLALIATCGLMWGGMILVFSMSFLVFLLRTAIARGLGNVDRMLMKTPLIAPLYEMFLRPVTYYRLDTTAMYLQAVQGATAEAFQSIFGDHAVNLLPDTVPPPVMESLYRRRSL